MIPIEFPPRAEFPERVLAELEQAPLLPAIYLSTIEHRAFPKALAAALPTVVHAPRQTGAWRDEHLFHEPATGAAVRLVLTLDPQSFQVVARIAELGPGGLWDRIVAAATQWDQDGRPAAG